MSALVTATSKYLYVVSQAPYSNASGQEALDAAFIGASFDLDVALLFVHDGVFQLLSGQNSRNSYLKEYTKAYKALEDFGIDNVYVHDLSLHARGINEAELMSAITLVDTDALRGLFSDQTKVFTF
jgi:tRNA 2-thiouridine synthesizing protein C